MPEQNGTKYELNAVKERIPPLLQANEGRCSSEFLARKLSTPLNLAERALRDFALLYECRTSIENHDEEGLHFHFSLPLRKRHVPHSLSNFLTWLIGSGFRKIVKLGLSLLLGLYGVFFILVVIRWGRGSTHGSILPGEFSEGNPWDATRSFSQRMLLFVAGTPQRLGQPWTMMENIYAFLAENSGAATAADIVGLTGCTYGTADRFMTWLMLVDQAEIHITETGHLLYLFPDFRRTSVDEPRKSNWIWEMPWAPSKHGKSGNPAHEILFFMFMAFAGALTTKLLLLEHEITWVWCHIIFADFPLILSSGALLIPFLRWLKSLTRWKKETSFRLRIDILRVLHDELRPYTLHEDLQKLSEKFGRFRKNYLRERFHEIGRSIRGELGEDGDHRESILSNTLQEEWKISIMARDRLRADAPPPGVPLI